MRVQPVVARHRAKKRLFREAKGNVGGRRRLLRTVKETIIRSRVFAYRDRKNRKRDFRRLWITRLSAAAMMRGLKYSELIHGLKLSGIDLNRKSLSELAISHPGVFDEICEIVKGALAENTVAA